MTQAQLGKLILNRACCEHMHSTEMAQDRLQCRQSLTTIMNLPFYNYRNLTAMSAIPSSTHCIVQLGIPFVT
jgi:hypothetical protein